jgi:hypothetical protein
LQEGADGRRRSSVCCLRRWGCRPGDPRGFLSILSPAFVSHFPHRMINVHPSLIPSFCGKGIMGSSSTRRFWPAGSR